MQHNWKKNTAIFMTSQAISILGSSLVQYAIVWHITLTMQSGFYAMISIICGFVPTLLLSPFAGVWADRYNRKRLIVLADAGIAVCTLVLALVFMSGYQEIWLLFAVLAIRAFGGAVQTPCIGAMLPDMVPEAQLTRVNGINSSLQSLITLVSPMLSGVLMANVAIYNIFFIDVVTAALAIFVMLAFFQLPSRPKELLTAEPDYFGELKEGFRYIGQNPYLRNFFVYCAGFFIMAAPVAFLTPLQVARSFQGGVEHLSAIEVAFSVGMLAGGLVMAAWGGMKNRIHTMVLAGIFMGLCTIGLGMPIPFWFYTGLMGLFGLVMPIFNTPAMVLLQERVDPNYMGRVFGVMTMISSSMMPLGMLIFGPIADFVRIEWLLLGTGLVLLLGSLRLLRNRPLLQAGAKYLEQDVEAQAPPQEGTGPEMPRQEALRQE